MTAGLRVLVADSDQHSRELLCNLLLLAGNEVALARNRQEALRLLRDMAFDAVVVAVKALQRSVIRTLREIERLRPKAAIVISCSQPEAASLARVEGYHLVYAKFFLEAAPELLQRAVSRRRSATASREPERRATRRIRDRVPVEFRLVGEGGAVLEPAGRALTRDLSPDGLMLEADRRLEPASILHLDFALGSPPCFLKALGRLCWVRQESEDLYSLGVCFTRINDEDRNWISNYVTRH